MSPNKGSPIASPRKGSPVGLSPLREVVEPKERDDDNVRRRLFLDHYRHQSAPTSPSGDIEPASNGKDTAEDEYRGEEEGELPGVAPAPAPERPPISIPDLLKVSLTTTNVRGGLT